MWRRKDLKSNAKAAFKGNYWRSVLVAILLTMAIGNGAASAVSSMTSSGTQLVMNDNYSEEYYENEYDGYASTQDVIGKLEKIMPPMMVKIFTALKVSIVLFFMLIAFVIRIFVFGPLEVGGCNYFKVNALEKNTLSTLGISFKKKYYWKMVSTIFLRNLYIVLWTFLFVIPGIIKAYEYKMVPYILADAPEITRKEAFRISKEMMRGNKWKTFVLELSFLGWDILAACTCGILNVFYVNPYRYATYAELFITLREDYFKNRG